jgi:hypothetical protein
MGYLVLLSAVGLIVSALVHFSTYVGFDPQSAGPAVWLLHIGVFIVFIPAVWVANIKRQSGVRKPNEIWPLAPRWMKILVSLLGFYAIVNFIVFFYLMFVVLGGGTPEKESGGYVLSNHGTVMRQISEEEYHRYRAYMVRGFSGHWMAFYAAAMTMAASAAAARRLEPQHDPPTFAGPSRGGRVPIWAHFAILTLASAVTFMGCLALMLLLKIRFGPIITGPGAIVYIIFFFFGLPLFVTVVLREVLIRRLPAKCPECGGHAYCYTKRPLRYLCIDCNHIEELNARIM